MKCFYHCDLDGKCAGSIVAKYENNYDLSNFFMVDYIDEIPVDIISNNERVYFVDYSFSENTLQVIQSLLSKNCDLIWIDHHTSSINLEKAHPELSNIKGIRLEGVSGAALSYMYLYNKQFDKLPYYVRLVSDYDCWKSVYEPDTTRFKLGMDGKKHDALDEIWMDFESELNLDVTENLNNVIDNGRVIKKYIDNTNIVYRDNYGYESIIDNYKCFVVNKKTNSWVFGDFYNTYPVVVVWVFNGSIYQYSIYSSDVNIDCSKIAESYGGGGHKGAAGFTSTELLFKKV